MRLRSQLVAAFLLLGGLPLAALVLTSYRSSIRAFHRAAEAAATGEAAELERRMSDVTGDLRQRVGLLGHLPLAEALAGGDVEAARAMRVRVVDALGSAAPLVESLEVVPVAPTPPEPAEPAEPPEPPQPPEPPRVIVLDVGQLVRESLEAEGATTLEAIADPAERRRAEAGLAIARSVATLMEGLRVPLPGPLLDEAPGGGLELPIRAAGDSGFELLPRINAEALLGGVLSRSRRDQGELPFAVDAEGKLYVALEEDRAPVEQAFAAAGATEGEPPPRRFVGADWVVVSSASEVPGVVLGIARPIRGELDGIRQAAVWNLGWGMAILVLAMLGVLPLSRLLAVRLRALTAGAERLAAGDLAARVAEGRRDEIGLLAAAFNRMAGDLATQRERLLGEERERARLAVEVERKGAELEEARVFQLSLLPKRLPEHPRYRLAVRTRTATEVGGDYYDLQEVGDELVLAVGDATGHGAKAGTMVTVIKSLFTADAGRSAPALFLAEATRTVRRMDLGRMAMALTVARLDAEGMTVAAAGMPPVFVYRRASTAVEEVALPGMPLGGVEDFPYREARLSLAPGDVALFLSDGLPELPEPAGDVLGYARVRERFAALAPGGAEAVVAGLLALVEARTGDAGPADDVTLLALEVAG